MERSPILNEMIETGLIGIVGGTYDLTSGKVSFYKDTLKINSPK
jgi:carbonic anhydrase